MLIVEFVFKNNVIPFDITRGSQWGLYCQMAKKVTVGCQKHISYKNTVRHVNPVSLIHSRHIAFIPSRERFSLDGRRVTGFA